MSNDSNINIYVGPQFLGSKRATWQSNKKKTTVLCGDLTLVVVSLLQGYGWRDFWEESIQHIQICWINPGLWVVNDHHLQQVCVWAPICFVVAIVPQGPSIICTKHWGDGTCYCRKKKGNHCCTADLQLHHHKRICEKVETFTVHQLKWRTQVACLEQAWRFLVLSHGWLLDRRLWWALKTIDYHFEYQ